MPVPHIKIETPYNPLARQNLGKSVADALLERSIGQLPLADPKAILTAWIPAFAGMTTG